MNYYDRSQNGDVRWYDWIAVFWLMVLIWQISSAIIISPFGDLLLEFDPVTATELALTATPHMWIYDSVQLKIASALLLLFSSASLVSLGIHYLGKRSAVSLWAWVIAMSLTVIATLALAYITSPLTEANALVLSVIGLSPVAYMLMLLTFPAALTGLYLGWKLVHKIPLTALHTAFAKFRWSRALQAFVIMWLVLGTYGFVMNRFSDTPLDFVFDAERFLPYAILSLLLLPIQSATEEIVVRGYMNKGLIHWFGNKWVAFTLTSGLFMVLHLANPEAQAGAAAGNLPIVMSGYFFFGFAMCLMVLIDDGLESAIGVHAGNNTFAAIFVNYENSVLPTPSVWQATPDPTSDAITVIIILTLVLGLLYVTRRPRLQASSA